MKKIGLWLTLISLLVFLSIGFYCVFYPRSIYTSDFLVTTEYGDEFRITHDRGDIFILFTGSDERYRIGVDANKSSSLEGVWDENGLRCYLMGGTIVYRKFPANNFERLGYSFDDLDFMIPVVKSVLLRNNSILWNYGSIFLCICEDETVEMLRNFIAGEYHQLEDYGFLVERENYDTMLWSAQRLLDNYENSGKYFAKRWGI